MCAKWEEAKTFRVYEDVMTKMIETGLDRKAVLIAFGGGVIGDLGGFVAATYMRGIPFIKYLRRFLRMIVRLVARLRSIIHLAKI